MRRWLLCCVFSGMSALCGCAPVQTFTKAQVPRGATIGILSTLQSELTNAHVGVTAFTTFNKRLANDWKLDETGLRDARSLLQSAGYRLVDIPLSADLRDALRREEDRSSLNDSGLDGRWSARYAEILHDNHLDALVVLREEIQRDRPESSNGWHGYGLFSGNIAELFVTATADVIAGSPIHRTIAWCVVGRRIDKARIAIEDWADIRPSDVPWMREELEVLMREKLEFELASSGLIASAQKCPGFTPGQAVR